MKKKDDYFVIVLAISCLIIPALYFSFTSNNEEAKAETGIIIDADDSFDLSESISVTENDVVEDDNVDTNEDTESALKDSAKPLEANQGASQEENNYEQSKEEEEINTFQKVDDSYFKDSLFIGDSRTVGLSEYGTLSNATFFATSGMSIYNVDKQTALIPKKGNYNLNQLLSGNQYKKIYVMLGINELGYNFEQNVKRYEAFIDQIKKAQPEAIIYIQANLHVTKERSDKDSIFNNKSINRFNDAIKQFEDKERVYYLDVNEIFDDSNGNLDGKYSGDGTHPFGKYYAVWCDWFKEHAIII